MHLPASSSLQLDVLCVWFTPDFPLFCVAQWSPFAHQSTKLNTGLLDWDGTCHHWGGNQGAFLFAHQQVSKLYKETHRLQYHKPNNNCQTGMGWQTNRPMVPNLFGSRPFKPKQGLIVLLIRALGWTLQSVQPKRKTKANKNNFINSDMFQIVLIQWPWLCHNLKSL